jgi:hypothetical protein
VEAYLEILAQRPRYSRWLDSHPNLGVQKAVTLLHGPSRPGFLGRGDPMIA